MAIEMATEMSVRLLPKPPQKRRGQFTNVGFGRPLARHHRPPATAGKPRLSDNVDYGNT